ncbi:MAG: DHHA1 domain-containing protein [bacterium]|nr:DHHA1 domain-containing protein [bacterium]
MEKWSLDMVGIATLSDMVPLVGENRILARFGLDVLRKSPRPGIKALLNRLGTSQEYLTEDDIVFTITPRINAASRMGSPEDAFNLLSATESIQAERLALHLEKINNERKGVVASVVKEAKKHLAMREMLGQVIVVGNPEWRPALAGLVANSLVEEYERPVFVWGRDGDGVLKGSCRSYNGYNLYELMGRTADSFIEYGGHVGAGGFSATLEGIATLEERLSLALANLESKETKDKNMGLDIAVADVCEDLWKVVSMFSPFGTGNQKPVFKINGKVKSVRQFGKENNHLELILADGNREVKAISFFSSPESYKVPLASGANICLLAHLEKSYFRNRPELRLRIVDIT